MSSLPAAGQDVAAGVPALYCFKYEKVQNMAKFSAGTPLPTLRFQRASQCARWAHSGLSNPGGKQC